MELWSLMHFLMPAIFASHNDFKDWFSNPLTDMMEGNAKWNAELVQRLHKVLRPFILRRLKADVEKQLPEKIEKVIKCPLSKRQRYLYDDFMAQRTTRENLQSGSIMSVLNIVMQLRKCCNHPNLFEPRPIVSPFVMEPLHFVYPAQFFNIYRRFIYVTTSSGEKTIKECDVCDVRSTGAPPAVSVLPNSHNSSFISSPTVVRKVECSNNSFSEPSASYVTQSERAEQSKTDLPTPSVENVSDDNQPKPQTLNKMFYRFTIYVHAAITDAPIVRASSSGRSAYVHFVDKKLSECRRKLAVSLHPLASQVIISQQLLFPELRLIEYDCGKLQVLSSLLRELYLYKHRCLIFTQMSRMLNILQAFLSFHGYQYFRLDGATGIEERQAMMERFNADPKIFCFILSTRSGGIGVNLTGADTVVFYDSDWNPTMDAQAQDRCHRIGQTRNVTIYRLVSERTIEENILRKAMQKRRLGELAIDEAGFTPDFFKGDNVRDLFEGETDVVVPVSVKDNAEIEKAMATLEDVQDVAAAKRANAEAKAELAEFEENQKYSSEGLADRSNSKYFEIIDRLKPIERYAVNFLEAEYKPNLDEEVKEAEAKLASKKDEWMKAQEIDEFDLTYTNGFSNTLDEVRKKKSPLQPPSTRNASQKVLTRCNGVTLRRRVDIRSSVTR
uniref:Helicase C-terminal domain-containing protein n=1 Tax=Syphacia muris TaxID=451379 RepID=A0A0N5ABZ3_9BILA